MLRWSKSQFQSRILKQKLPLILFTILVVSITPQVFAQSDLDVLLENTNGVLIEQQTIVFEVERHSDVRIKHVIETGAWNFDRPRIIEIIPGLHSNISVADEDGDSLNFSYDGQTFEESNYIILNQKNGNYDLIAEYDLENFLDLENNLWTKEIQFNHDVMIYFEEDIELIFVNSRPVDLEDAKGINCMGCDMYLEFFNEDKIIYQNIMYNDKEHQIEILTDNKISELEFVGGGSEILNFNIEEGEQLIVLKIPFELLLNPFSVYFTEEDDTELDQLDKIRKSEYGQSDSHVNLSFRTDSKGTISIVGANSEEHQKLLEQIQKRNEMATETTIIENEKGVALPLPGQGSQNSKEVSEDEGPKLSFEDELQKGQQESSQDYTIILAIIGIIAAIIIGIIVKIKRN